MFTNSRPHWWEFFQAYKPEVAKYISNLEKRAEQAEAKVFDLCEMIKGLQEQMSTEEICPACQLSMGNLGYRG